MSIRASLGIHNIVFDVGENDEIGHAVERASTALMKYVSAQLIRNLFNKG
jgi:hypothetical protein